MVLYKYMIHDRIDVIRDPMIRFTQPGLFNDPFESLPYLKSIGSDSTVYDAILKTIDQLGKSEWEALPKSIRGNITFTEIQEFVREHPERVLKNFRESEPGVLPEQLHKIYDLVNDAVGVLSLAERRDSLLMWAHYACYHRGFILGLDSKHEFFTPEREPDDPFNRLERVSYTNERPQITLSDLTEKELLLYKSKEWEYEKEWRFIRYLVDATKVKSVDGHNCYLFCIPPNCFQEVIFGCRMAEGVKDELKKLISIDPLLNHIKIFQAMLDPKEYVLRFVNVAF